MEWTRWYTAKYYSWSVKYKEATISSKFKNLFFILAVYWSQFLEEQNIRPLQR